MMKYWLKTDKMVVCLNNLRKLAKLVYEYRKSWLNKKLNNNLKIITTVFKSFLIDLSLYLKEI